jgi:hypothetical protein
VDIARPYPYRVATGAELQGACGVLQWPKTQVSGEPGLIDKLYEFFSFWALCIACGTSRAPVQRRVSYVGCLIFPVPIHSG